ncbi:MAG: universal stress protein [Acidimicrobiales bacterium]|nr:universal stress protein [Acidimicrobiales bacterium]
MIESSTAWIGLLAADAGGVQEGQRLVNIPHHELLVFWVQILALWAVARMLGALARRVGLPSVVGELSAGLMLGPSIFGVLWDDGFDWFLPGYVSGEVQGSLLLLGVSWFSAAFLLVVAGFETDLNLITRLGRPALLVTVGSVVVPFVGGLVVGAQLPQEFWGDAGDRLTVTLFIAVSVAVSALAVVAKVLSDLNLMRRDVGQITVAAGMANDLVGWIILGIISGLAVSGGFNIVGSGLTVLGLVAFLAGSLTIGQRVIDASLRAVRREGANLQGALTVSLAAMFVFGVITQWLGVEAVLGTFVAGVVLARSRYQQSEAAHVIEDLTSVVFAPLFFATAGLRVDLGLLRGNALTWTLILLAVALGLKFAGAFGGALAGGLSTREGLILGAGLNARGALEIIIATVALSLGVFNETAFTMIVIIPLITSLIASVGVRALAQNLEGSVAERERLAREAALAKNLVVRGGRILIPSEGSKSSIVASQVVHFAWPSDQGATVVAINDREGNAPDLEPITNTLFGRQTEFVEAADSEAAEALVAQSKLGYSVAAFGVPDQGGAVLSQLADDLLSELQIPMVLVRRARNTGNRLPGIFARALVPVTGSQSSRAALELAGNLSANLGTQLMLSHVIYQAPPAGAGGVGLVDRIRDAAIANSQDAAASVLANAAAQAQELRAGFEIETRFAPSVSDEIMRHANQIDADLIILGAEVRRLESRAFLGQNVQSVLDHAPQTVVVVVLPINE